MLELSEAGNDFYFILIGGEIKKEILDEEEEGDESEEGSEELDAAQSDEVEKENGKETIKEEVTEGEDEGLLEANPEGNNLLPGGINVAIDMDLLRDLKLKEEDIAAGHALVSLLCKVNNSHVCVKTSL